MLFVCLLWPLQASRIFRHLVLLSPRREDIECAPRGPRRMGGVAAELSKRSGATSRGQFQVTSVSACVLGGIPYFQKSSLRKPLASPGEFWHALLFVYDSPPQKFDRNKPLIIRVIKGCFFLGGLKQRVAFGFNLTGTWSVLGAQRRSLV